MWLGTTTLDSPFRFYGDPRKIQTFVEKRCQDIGFIETLQSLDDRWKLGKAESQTFRSYSTHFQLCLL